MRIRSFCLVMYVLLFLLGPGPATSMEIRVYRANGETVDERDVIGGLCLVGLEPAGDESIGDLHVTADNQVLHRVEENPDLLFRLPCHSMRGNVSVRAEWRDGTGNIRYVQKNIRISNIRLKIRLEIPDGTPADRVIYATGNLFELGMRPDGEWNPRYFPLEPIGRGHWFGSLSVGAEESVELEFTMGGWGTKGRDKSNRVVHIVQNVPYPLEIATRIHSWGERIGSPDPRPPHLSIPDPGGNDIVISFRPDEEIRTMRFGDAEDDLSGERVSLDEGGTFLHVKDLDPGIRYFYRIEGEDPVMTFQMPRSPDLTFHVIGDTKGIPDVIDAMYQHGISHLVIDTGDLVTSGWNEDAWDLSLEAISVVASRAPYMVAPGNHEEESPLFGEIFHFPHEEYYYAFHFGPARFLILDTERPYEPGTRQRVFADSVLSAWRMNPDIPSFVALHAPPYSSGKHGSDLHLRNELCHLFEKAGVDIVFSGHDHGYESTWPLAGGVRNDAGTVYVVSAGGGGTLYETRSPRREWSRIREKTYHWVTVEVRGQRISVRVITPDGRLIDQFHSTNGVFSLSDK